MSDRGLTDEEHGEAANPSSDAIHRQTQQYLETWQHQTRVSV